MTNNLQTAQQDMRNGYGYGSSGVFSSGLVWLCAAVAVKLYGVNTGIWTVIIGGMIIFPLSMLIGKLLGIAANTTAETLSENQPWKERSG